MHDRPGAQTCYNVSERYTFAGDIQRQLSQSKTVSRELLGGEDYIRENIIVATISPDGTVQGYDLRVTAPSDIITLEPYTHGALMTARLKERPGREDLAFDPMELLSGMSQALVSQEVAAPVQAQ